MTTAILAGTAAPGFAPGARWARRVAAVFVAGTILPLDPYYWATLLQANWTAGRFEPWFALAQWSLRWPALEARFTVPWSFLAGPAVLLAVSLVAGTIWSRLDRGPEGDAALAYGTRVLARYRLALALIAYGLIKIFPLQFPTPTLSDLHTAYGDFLPWKLYALTNGIATARYQSMLGAVELAAALLLLHRRTATIGAGLAAAVLLNVVLVNFAYNLGDQGYALLLLALAAFLLVHDTPRLFRLLVQGRRATADRSEPREIPLLASLRRATRGLMGFWALTLALTATRSVYLDGGVYPREPGLEGTAGYYRVVEFRRTGAAGPRWRDAVFETWNTFSIGTGSSSPRREPAPPIATRPTGTRGYEEAGNGGRRFFRYTVDTDQSRLEVVAKDNPAERFSLRWEKSGERTLVLQGNDATGGEINAVLERVDQRYLLREGRRRPVTLN